MKKSFNGSVAWRTMVWTGFIIAVLGQTRAAASSDVLLSDFEGTNYGWLPGGVWAVTGTAFGLGPVQGTLSNQNPVAGYLGNSLVNSYLGGDGSTGTLTSPSFMIQRNYLRFLIGGGNQRGKTCMNLIVNGRVVCSAVGMGDREDLSELQWNVSNLINSNATLQIVDMATNGWGHINVDQIVQTDTLLDSVITITNRYLNLPVKTGATSRRFELVVDGLVTHEFFVELADTVTPDFYSFLDLSNFQGKQALVRVDSAAATTANLNSLVWSNSIVGSNTFYQEANRPIYHVTARRGWLNDPNGLVYFNGEYHLGFQHNPYGWNWANMHWAHEVSADLVHWTELPEWLYPDPLGAEWSGSAVVDWNNSAGFGTNAMVAFFTGAAKVSDPNLPRMANAGQFTQCMAYSLDSGRTWVKYTNNPVVPNLVGGDNRDPKVFWYAPGNKWVMVLWLINNDYGVFSSPNLKNWTQTSTFTFPGVIEVPDLFELPLDGNAANKQWVFWGGAGNYYLGMFDGDAFTAQSGPFTLRGGNCFAATQTYNNIPGDARRILIVHGTVQFPGMPFNNNINFPLNLTLRTSPSGVRLYANPIPELALLHTSTNIWPAQSLVSGSNVMSGVSGEAFELDVRFKPGTAANLTFTVRGTKVTYNCAAQTISCSGTTQALAPSNGIVHLQMLVDRGIIEIFGNDGLLYMPMRVTPTSGKLPLSLVANGSGAQLVSLNMYDLGSAWSNVAAGPTLYPTITTPPVSVVVNLGSLALFSIAAASVSPLFYQWFSNNQPIFGATNNSLSIFPAIATNLNFSVVVSNVSGMVTSGPVSMSIRAPYKVAFWRMEAQMSVPNNAGVPTWAGIADFNTNNEQGIYTTGNLPASIDNLITFNGLSGGPVALTNIVAPAAMFVNGHDGGSNSYNAAAIAEVDGCLFFPQDQYGDELDFTGPFSIEMFFKSEGNQSGSGIMQLISQGTDTGQYLRYGIDVNAAGAGAVRFTLVNSFLVQTSVVDLADTNYADGQWHYLLAVLSTLDGSNGLMRLTIVNQDGSEAVATNYLSLGFLPLPAENDGNAFLGRYTYPVTENPRTFRGCIDEVQITAGVVPDSWRLGKIPSVDNHPQIKAVSLDTNGIRFQWTGAAPNDFLVQWAGRLGDAWQTIATLPSADGSAGFVDVDTTRLNGASGFYRILEQ